MPTFDIEFTNFRYPKALPNEKANFRFVVDLRLRED